jgi:uncharacterized protein (TIGR03437 family)
VVVNQDGSINSAANPAAAGSIVSLYGTGEGRVTPQLIWGDLSISTPYSTPDESVTVSVAGQPAQVTYAGAAPFQPIGVLQVNARIPAGATGSVPVVVSAGGTAAAPVNVAVR